jgi:ParB family chromosome partitioning protein
MQAHEIPLKEIFADDEFNCRGRVAPIDVVDLMRSIEAVGLQQPIVVQPWTNGKKYRILAGHRRFMAYKGLAKETIPAFIRENVTEIEAFKINLIENVARQDLNLVQEANGIHRFMAAGLTQDDIARELNKTRGWVQIRCAVLDLPKDIQEVIANGYLTQAEIREIHGLPTAKQYEAVKLIKEKKQRGEKVDLNFKERKPKPFARRERKRHEVFSLQERIRDTMGPNIMTRILGWCAGEVNDFEIHRDLRDYARENDLSYEIPQELMQL